MRKDLRAVDLTRSSECKEKLYFIRLNYILKKNLNIVDLYNYYVIFINGNI